MQNGFPAMSAKIFFVMIETPTLCHLPMLFRPLNPAGLTQIFPQDEQLPATKHLPQALSPSHRPEATLKLDTCLHT